MNIFDFASRATPLHSVPASNAVKSNMAANAEFQDLAASGDEYERPRKIPKTLKEKDSGKRLIVVLEKASLETVKVDFRSHTTGLKYFL